MNKVMTMKTIRTLIGTLAVCLMSAEMLQAQTLQQIDNDAAVADFTGVDFSGQTLQTSISDYARNDNFTNANLTNTVLNFTNNDRAFNRTILVDADFTGATINWQPLVTLGSNLVRYNMFTDFGNDIGGQYSGLNMSNTIWNIDFNGAEGFSNAVFFQDGPGSIDPTTGVVDATDAVNFVGASFTFSNVGATAIRTEATDVFIDNLGAFDGVTPIGAFYDDTFLDNNFSTFGFNDADALETRLSNAGWQIGSAVAVPEPSSMAIVGIAGLGLAIIRRRK